MLTTATKNTMLDAVTITQASLHSADPGATGANELSGGAYARKSVTIPAASGGERKLSTTTRFDVPAGATVSHVGYWNGSTFVGGDQLTATESYAAAGSYDVTSIAIDLNG